MQPALTRSVEDQHRRMAVAAALIALTLLGAALRFWRIGHQGFWYDEADTASLMHLSAGRMLGLLPHTESTPPFYYCLAWVWSRLFGDSEAPLRSLSALLGTLVIPTLALAATRLTGSWRTGLIAAALAATNPLLIWYSQEARAYELVVALCALSWLALAGALDAPESSRAPHGWLALWAACAALAMASEYYAVVVVIPEAVILVWRWRRAPALVAAVSVVVLVALALVPLLVAQNHAGNDRWIAGIPLGLRVGQVFPQFAGGPNSPLRDLLRAVGCVLGGVGLLALVAWRPRRGRLIAAATLSGLVLALAFLLGSDTLLTRNLIGLWPGAAIAVAAGLGAIPLAGPRRAVAPLVVTGLCAVGVIAAVGVATTYALQRPNWRPLAALLQRQDAPAPGTGRMILVQRYGHELPLSLYLPRLHFASRTAAEPDVDAIDVIALGGEPGPSDCWWGAGCNLSPSTLQANYPIPGFRPVGVRRVEQFTVLELEAARPESVSWSEVAAAMYQRSLRDQTLLIQPRSGA